MAITFVGGSGYSGSNSMTITMPLPGGSAVDDVAIIGVATSDSTNQLSFPSMTEAYNELTGTSYMALAYKVLDSTDIAAGGLDINETTGTNVRGCCVVYRGVDSVGTIGAATKRSGSSNTIFAAGVPLAAGDLAVVARLEKSTGNSGPVTSSPSVTQRQTYLNAGTANPSVVLAETSVSSQDVTFTDPVSSGNGVGMQLPLRAGTTPPPAPTVSVWDGTTEITGATMTVWDGANETPIDPGSIQT